MKRYCPNENCRSKHVIKSGFYHRVSDGHSVQRFQCQECKIKFSPATNSPTYGQNKRRLNPKIFELLASGMSQNRAARVLHTTRNTIARKLKFLGTQCHQKNLALLKNKKLITSVVFDELETFEHTKCKPLAVAAVVQETTRLILDVQVSSAPAKGRLAKVSLKRYGKRADQRKCGLEALFHAITPFCAQDLHVSSDMCPLYGNVLENTLGAIPGMNVSFSQYKGARSRHYGLGELKALVFDPLFSINHTLAMYRANINRLFRRTWCTTKKPSALLDHLWIYVYYHNHVLLKA